MIRQILLAMCCIVAAGCGGGDDGGEAFKARLVGEWVSDHSRYEGCLMVLQRNRMVFQADDGTIRTNAISGIDYKREDGGHLLRLHMIEAGEPAFIMSVYLETGSGGDRLRFKNQPQVLWRHAPTP